MKRNLLLIGWAVFVYGQEPKPSAEELEAMERLASQPSTRVVWQDAPVKVVAGKTEAVIAPVVLEDGSTPPLRMAGLRIDLADGDRRDRVYLRESHLERVIEAFREIGRRAPASLEDRNGSANRCLGSGYFWRQQGHSLTASQCVFGDWSGLVVNGFRFAGVPAAAFGNSLDNARQKLPQP
ncbi:MAG: hypothetical protein JNL98_29260 [Bryobacterales bacterium]|nr:hypothetical protein [Bryobacterales bacterium]